MYHLSDVFLTPRLNTQRVPGSTGQADQSSLSELGASLSATTPQVAATSFHGSGFAFSLGLRAKRYDPTRRPHTSTPQVAAAGHSQTDTDSFPVDRTKNS